MINDACPNRYSMALVKLKAVDETLRAVVENYLHADDLQKKMNTNQRSRSGTRSQDSLLTESCKSMTIVLMIFTDNALPVDVQAEAVIPIAG